MRSDLIRGAVVALGNFDGFHLGHQAVVGRAIARARTEGRPCLVAIFDPHPARLFRPNAAPFLLTSIAQRMRLFTAFGADGALALPFDRPLAALSPEEFVACWLRDHLGAAVVVTGADFHFGRGRSGDTAALAAIGARHGIAAEAVDLVRTGSGAVSSTRIRQHLSAGEINVATRLLGRRHRIEGIVRRGMGRGHVTADVSLGDYLRPRSGVYAVRGHLPDGRMLHGLANVADGRLALRLRNTAPGLDCQTIGVELISFLGPEEQRSPIVSTAPAMSRPHA